MFSRRKFHDLDVKCSGAPLCSDCRVRETEWPNVILGTLVTENVPEDFNEIFIDNFDDLLL